MTGGQARGVQDVAVLLQRAQEEQGEEFRGPRRRFGCDSRAAKWNREEMRRRTEGLPHELRRRQRLSHPWQWRRRGRFEAVVDELGLPRAAAEGRRGAEGEGEGAAHEGREEDAEAEEPRAEDVLLLVLWRRRTLCGGGGGERRRKLPLHRPEPG